MQLKVEIPKYWPSCRENNNISVILPSFFLANNELKKIANLLEKWQIIGDIKYDQNNEFFLAKSDEARLDELLKATNNEKSNFICAAKGGYGSSRIIKDFLSSTKLNKFKLLTGFSDITSLHLAFNNCLNLSTLHSPVLKQIANNEIDKKSIDLFKKIIFKEIEEIYYDIKPINNLPIISSRIPKILGGNLTLIQNSIGTKWQINNNGEYSMLIEDIDEEAYKIDRMLNHLENANIFSNCKLILIGDIKEKADKNNIFYLDYVIEKFTSKIDIPTFRIKNIGHGKSNLSIPLGVNCEIFD